MKRRERKTGTNTWPLLHSAYRATPRNLLGRPQIWWCLREKPSCPSTYQLCPLMMRRATRKKTLHINSELESEVPSNELRSACLGKSAVRQIANCLRPEVTRPQTPSRRLCVAAQSGEERGGIPYKTSIALEGSHIWYSKTFGCNYAYPNESPCDTHDSPCRQT